MRGRIRRRFGNLRWKLTWASVWVSVVISILINAVLFALLVLLNPSPTPATLFEKAQRHAADLAPLFVGEPDQAQVATAMRYEFGSSSATVDSLAAANVNVGQTFNIYSIPTLDHLDTLPDEFFTGLSVEPVTQTAVILALVPDGRILAGTFPRTFVTGATLDDPALPAAAALVQAALTESGSGEDAASRLSAINGPYLGAAAPIRDSAGVVRGVLYIRSAPQVIDHNALIIEITVILVATLVSTVFLNALIGLIFGWFASRGLVRRLKTLAQATDAVASGNLTPRISDSSSDEIGHLGRQFNAMADQLQANMRALRQLADSNAALAEQAGQLATIEERNRLARDLHDSVSQELFSLTMLAAAARNLLPHDPEKAKSHLEQLSQMAQRALHEVRGLIFALRPAALGDHGLAPALRQLRDEAGRRQGLAIDLQILGERRIPLEHEQTLYRITQEALANVTKHSGMVAVSVALAYGDSQTSLEIRDQGRGFDPGAPRNAHSLGLISINERASAVGGTCEVRSELGRGTTVRVNVPLKD